MSFGKYAWIVISVFAGLSALYQLQSRAVRLTCWSGGYSQNAWLAYCNSPRYGVYDTDAIWFEGEPEVAAAIGNAQILTLSDSRLQNALSIGGASQWFSSRHLKAYFLGLPTEESGFGSLLWDKFRPHARVVIFDASPYFTGQLGAQENSILEDAKARRQEVVELKDFQKFHRHFCTSLPVLCGQNFAYFRSRADGHWIFPDPDSRPLWGSRSVPSNRTHQATGVRPNELLPLYPEYLKAARTLISKIDLPPRCIVITHVPSEDSLETLAPYLADALGASLVDPKLDGIETFDRAHLTPVSAQRWSQAFLKMLEPVLQSCITGA